MWLVLCNTGDAVARWAFSGLRARGLAPLELVTAEELCACPRFEHRLSTTDVSTLLTLRDGRTIDSHEVNGVLNRLAWLPLEHLWAASQRDQEYAAQEFYALFISWLRALSSCILNPPTPRDLSGNWRPQLEWMRLASRAGMRTASLRVSSDDFQVGSGPLQEMIPAEPAQAAVIVAGDEVNGGSAPPAIREDCRKLSKLAGTPLIGVNFAVTEENQWLFSSASALPDLRIGGPRLLDTLASILTDG